MKLSKRQLRKIIKERVYTSKNMQRLSYSHEKFLDRQREKKYLQSPEYYNKKMIEYSVGLLEAFTENDEEEIEEYRDELGTDDIDAIIEIYEGIIRKLRES